jgi:hypothetical protein
MTDHLRVIGLARRDANFAAPFSAVLSGVRWQYAASRDGTICVSCHCSMIRHRIPAFGLFLTLLALVAQLAFGAVVPRPEVGLVLDELGVICHAPAPSGGAPQPDQHRHTPDCVLCPLCASLATHGIVLPGAAPRPPLPQVAEFERPGLPPPATAPPVAVVLSAQPRGPPILA